MPDQKPPTDVKIVDAEKPLEVIVKPTEEKKDVVNKGEGKTLAPNTTEQEDITKEGQRNINILWETTQSQIARATIYCNLFINIVVVILLIVYRREVSKETIIVIMACLASMNGLSGIVIGFYFGRTNHTKIGGVAQEQSGR